MMHVQRQCGVGQGRRADACRKIGPGSALAIAVMDGVSSWSMQDHQGLVKEHAGGTYWSKARSGSLLPSACV